MACVIFCHGMPGGPADADLLRGANSDAVIDALNLLDCDAANLDHGLKSALDAVLANAPDAQVTLVGFSIGAMAAIRLAAMRPENVSRLVLISPAAPLSLGDFLPDMAGRPVFELARKAPVLLHILTGFQGLIVRISPKILINMLFAKCGPSEKELLKDAAFRDALAQGLVGSLARKPKGYLAFVSAYVADWSDVLPDVKCPVVLWHGTKDTWSPPAMSEALVDAFSEPAALNLVEDGEHYSTLAQAVL